MGSRTSSAPAGGLHKLDPGRRSGPNVGNTLMEEEEVSSPGESNTMSKRSRSRQPGEEVRGEYACSTELCNGDDLITNFELLLFFRESTNPVFQK